MDWWCHVKNTPCRRVGGDRWPEGCLGNQKSFFAQRDIALMFPWIDGRLNKRSWKWRVTNGLSLVAQLYCRCSHPTQATRMPCLLCYVRIMDVKWWLLLFNPLTTVGTYLSHENWPLNWPDFAASPALLGWPARSRHTVACMHRFSHILLRRPPEPAVWFMSEWRAVAIEHARKICGPTDHFQQFWNATDVQGLYNASSIMLNNPFDVKGMFSSHENWPLNWPDFAASLALLGWPACSWHTVACMHWFSHILRRPPEPAVWFMSQWRAVTIEHARKIGGPTDHFQQFWNGYGHQRVKVP